MSVEKGPDAFRTISEVAEDLDLPQHVLRFWETRFPQIRPLKRGGGRRYYRPDDIELLRGIRHLLYTEGYTIRGVQRILKDEGPRYVQAIWRDAEAEAAEIDAYEERERRPAPREAGTREPGGRGAAREDVDAGHPGRGDARAEGRGGPLSGLLNLLPSRQRAAPPREAAERGSFERDAFEGDDSFEADPFERGPGPSAPREPSLREPEFREPPFREPPLREPQMREPPIREPLPRDGAPRNEIARDEPGLDPIGREPIGREVPEPPRLFADEPPPPRRGGRRRAESEPDFLELPLLPDLAPQSRPPRAEPGRREAETGARYIGPLDASGTDTGPESFAPRRAEPLPRPAVSSESRTSFPFRAVAPEPEIDEALAFAPRAETRPPHILARQNSRPMPVATPAQAPVAAPIPQHPPAAMAPAPSVVTRAPEEARGPEPAPLAREDIQRLQAALYELQECRRILDAARG